MNKIRKFLSNFRKIKINHSKVYPGENIFDYILDLFPSDKNPLFKPIFLIGSARSGTTVTFSLLQYHPYIACLYEANIKWMNFFRKRRDTNEHGDLLYASDATSKVVNYLRKEFNNYRKREGKPVFAEKDPRNSIRLDFVYRVFPDARYLILFRDPYYSICSLIKRHEQARQQFKNHKKDNQWWRSGDAWAEQRIPGWKQLREKPTFEAALTQYSYTMKKMLNDIQLIPENNKMILKYEDLLNHPVKFQVSLYEFIQIPYLNATKAVISKIYKPQNIIKELLSPAEIRRINDECLYFFNKMQYEMLIPSL